MNDGLSTSHVTDPVKNWCPFFWLWFILFNIVLLASCNQITLTTLKWIGGGTFGTNQLIRSVRACKGIPPFGGTVQKYIYFYWLSKLGPNFGAITRISRGELGEFGSKFHLWTSPRRTDVYNESAQIGVIRRPEHPTCHQYLFLVGNIVETGVNS